MAINMIHTCGRQSGVDVKNFDVIGIYCCKGEHQLSLNIIIEIATL